MINSTINIYKKQWFPEDPKTKACVLELPEVDEEDRVNLLHEEPAEVHSGELKSIVICEDYRQTIPFPSCR